MFLEFLKTSYVKEYICKLCSDSVKMHVTP